MWFCRRVALRFMYVADRRQHNIRRGKLIVKKQMTHELFSRLPSSPATHSVRKRSFPPAIRSHHARPIAITLSVELFSSKS